METVKIEDCKNFSIVFSYKGIPRFIIINQEYIIEMLKEKGITTLKI